MTDRLTVVFDDPDLYRRVKVRAAEDGVTVKSLIERGLRELLGEAHGGTSGNDMRKEWDWDAYDRWQAEAEELDRALGGDYPRDLSNVKKYLYGDDRPPMRPRVGMVAEERAVYDAR